MNKKNSIMTMLMILFVGIELAIGGAKVTKLSGDVKVRRGVEEDWQPASVGILLEDIDTEWKRISPGAVTANSLSGRLGFFVTGTFGTDWIDVWHPQMEFPAFSLIPVTVCPLP